MLLLETGIYPKQQGGDSALELLSYRPMKRLAVALAFSVLALSLGGCVVRTHPHRHSHAVKTRGCHPSQYWDGHKCRHKGKGHGARKHDGW